MSRAASTVLGALLLTAVTLVLAAVAGVAVVDSSPPARAPEPVVLSASADADTGRIVLVHESGPTLDVREVEVRIAVDGTYLRHQPPVPFSAATGFRWPPTGPFNDATDPRWRVGERAGLWVARTTNDPNLISGVTVRVEVYRDDLPIAAVETTAR